MFGQGSTSAFQYCKQCNADTRRGDPRLPFSFLQRLVTAADTSDNKGWRLRTQPDVQVESVQPPYSQPAYLPYPLCCFNTQAIIQLAE